MSNVAVATTVTTNTRRRLLDLVEIMTLFNAFDLWSSLVLLESHWNAYSMMQSAGAGGIQPDPSIVSQVGTDIALLIERCRPCGFQGAINAAELANLRFRSGGPDVSSIVVELDHVRAALLLDLKFNKFLQVKIDRRHCIDNAELFGPEVNNAFPKAIQDIREAGNCMAVECSTAAVFHLMRVAEHGLRKLAKKLHIKLTHKGSNHPIEFVEWGKVITAIKIEIANARTLGPGPKRQAVLEKYSDAADHCDFMKDIWRNNVSHTRKPYSDPDAVAVLQRVRGFMKFLAANQV